MGAPPGTPLLELDEDDLWVCYLCRKKLRSPPVGRGEELVEGLETLVGKSAGRIGAPSLVGAERDDL